jgi:hypothetical protein
MMAVSIAYARAALVISDSHSCTAVLWLGGGRTQNILMVDCQVDIVVERYIMVERKTGIGPNPTVKASGSSAAPGIPCL